MESQPRATEIDRPFMLMTAEFTRAAAEAVEELWSHLTRLAAQRGGRRRGHSAYCDHQWLVPQLAAIIGMSDEELGSWVGTLDPARGVRIQQAYPLAFFDLHLRHRGHLLDGPSRAFPEVRFLP